MQALLYVNQLLENVDDAAPRQEIRLVTDIRNRMACEPLAERVAVVQDLVIVAPARGVIQCAQASLLSTAVSPTEFTVMVKVRHRSCSETGFDVQALLSGVGDSEADCGIGAAAILRVSRRFVDPSPCMWAGAVFQALERAGDLA